MGIMGRQWSSAQQSKLKIKISRQHYRQAGRQRVTAVVLTPRPTWQPSSYPTTKLKSVTRVAMCSAAQLINTTPSSRFTSVCSQCIQCVRTTRFHKVQYCICDQVGTLSHIQILTWCHIICTALLCIQIKIVLDGISYNSSAFLRLTL